METCAIKATAGFTLVEFVLVILVISVLAVSVNILWPGLTMNLDAQAEEILNDIRYTQTLAMTHDQRYCFVISGSTYQIVNSATSSPLTLAAGNTTITLSSGITFGSISPSGVVFVFDGEGVPYTTSSCTAANASAATALAATASIPVTGGGQTRTISITPATGWVISQ